MSNIVSSNHQIGQNTTADLNITLNTDTNGDLVINRGVYPTLTEISRFPNAGGGQEYMPAGTGAVATTVQDELRQRVSVRNFGASGSIANNVAAFKLAITHLKSLGGGVLAVSADTYSFDIASEADTLLIDFDDFAMECEPGTKFEWDYYGLPLIAVIGANRIDIGNIWFNWTGTRGASPASADHYGYDGTGVLSPPDWCAHIAVGGSSFVNIHDIRISGQTTANNLEVGIALWNGTASGPSGTADAYNNTISNIVVDDVFFGLSARGQAEFGFQNIQSGRYKTAGHVGQGHVIYATALMQDGFIDGVLDYGQNIDTVGNATTLKLDGLTRTSVSNIKSYRQDGIASLNGGTIGCDFSAMKWIASGTTSVSANIFNITPGIANYFINNTFDDVSLIDTGATSPTSLRYFVIEDAKPSLCYNNIFDIYAKIHTTAGQSVASLTLLGNNSYAKIKVANTGTAEKTIATLKGYDAGDKSTNFRVDVDSVIGSSYNKSSADANCSLCTIQRSDNGIFSQISNADKPVSGVASYLKEAVRSTHRQTLAATATVSTNTTWVIPAFLGVLTVHIGNSGGTSSRTQVYQIVSGNGASVAQQLGTDITSGGQITAMSVTVSSLTVTINVTSSSTDTLTLIMGFTAA